MEAGKAIRRIVIIGQGVRGWLPAAYLAARFPDGRCQINFVETGGARTDDVLLARPSIRRFHQLLQMPERVLVETAKAQLSHGVRARAAGGAILLPFGQYGYDHAGAEFQQYWCRAFKMGKAHGLGRYNLAAGLAEAGAFLTQAPQGQPALDFGYQMSAAGYCALLQAYARGHGAVSFDAAGFEVRTDEGGFVKTIHLAGADLDCDMVIDARTEADVLAAGETPDLGWQGNRLYMPSHRDADLPGLELYSLVEALDRLIALWPDKDFLACEREEYNRLIYAERDRISDMKTLLEHGVIGVTQSDALARKISVFSNRGRIAAEDHEVFTKPEWLAALIGCGIVPAHYDRLVDRMSLEDLVRWLASIEDGIGRTVEQAKSAARVV